MKIRTGFVSNSSSTSFIVAIGTEVCEHCGRQQANLMEDVIRLSSSHGDETRFCWDDPSDFLQELDLNINAEKNTINSLKNLDPESMAGYENRYKVSDLLKWSRETLNSHQYLSSEIRRHILEGRKVINFYISYHDLGLQRLVEDNAQSGDIEIIERSEY